MDTRALQNLDQAIRQLIAVVNNNTAVTMAGLPQFYTLEDLAGRYRVGRETVRALLIEHRMIAPAAGPGRRVIRVPLESVLRLDRILKSGM
jgi:hypothetical protein